MSIIIGRYIKIYNIIIITSVCDCDAVKNGSLARPNETINNNLCKNRNNNIFNY